MKLNSTSKFQNDYRFKLSVTNEENESININRRKKITARKTMTEKSFTLRKKFKVQNDVAEKRSRVFNVKKKKIYQRRNKRNKERKLLIVLFYLLY